MRRLSPLWLAGPIILVVCLAYAIVRADQGMWLYTSPPTKLLKEKYQFEAEAKWLDHLQKSSIRFPSDLEIEVFTYPHPRGEPNMEFDWCRKPLR